MSTMDRQNSALAGLLYESGWQHGQFARAINAAGTRVGLALKCDASSVSHWLIDGTSPRVRTQELILQVLSARLKRPVTSMEAGFGGPRLDAGGGNPVTGLMDLARADMDPSRRAVLGAGLYSAVLAIPGWQDVIGRIDMIQTDPNLRIGRGEVESVIAMTDLISGIDDRQGGRYARPMAASYLVNAIGPFLRAEAPDDVRRAMLSAAADHCYLTGYMAMDERLDGLANQYYVKALELARLAGDELTYCTTLRGMSVMHGDLGDGATAMRLAEGASAASPQAGPRMRAFLAGQEAHAAALVGDRPLALLRIQQAETAMEKAESQAKAIGSYDPSALHYHLSQVHYELGDLKGAIESMQESHRIREPVYRRTRVRYGAMLAERKFTAGRVEEACADWHLVLDEYPLVQSGRADDRFRRMQAMIKPYLGSPHVRELDDRARSMAR
ncbi:tetratricopeptide repeat protein [Kitasatospora sp. NPDC052868]|uniref:tetratricopeptide repeat protein n=1 Tax=Kitasatospora sp. NPDC052868 TaxID=3364060 RepID=UPI0037CB1B62